MQSTVCTGHIIDPSGPTVRALHSKFWIKKLSKHADLAPPKWFWQRIFAQDLRLAKGTANLNTCC